MDHFAKLAQYIHEEAIPQHLATIIKNFFLSYHEAIEENGYDIRDLHPILKKFLDLVVEQLANPYPFQPYHKSLTHPFDYYQFGLDLLRPLVVISTSKIRGIEQVNIMEEQLARGENVILLANHQTEPDPQAISILLENSHPHFAKEMIFVAGNRVISDPLAAPFSKGRNLICIFSKRHLETSPEQKQERLRHNQRAMKKLAELLSEGGKCIYVAPSGGRDRQNAKGNIEVAPFDPQSIEMFWLIAQQSGRLTHFYPLTLATYNLLPPPSSIEKDIGESRLTHCTPIHMAFSPEIDMENFPGSDTKDKKQKRQKRANFIWQQVAREYTLLMQ